jgi:signal transduction histidine kinase
VLADLSQLERAFDNLVENALQATPHYGLLRVGCRAEDRGRPGVRVTIADTGLGIPADVRPNVFEPFVTTKPAGTGLGLAITRRVVLDHEGQIDFETDHGRGTTFVIWLPRA